MTGAKLVEGMGGGQSESNSGDEVGEEEEVQEKDGGEKKRQWRMSFI